MIEEERVQAIEKAVNDLQEQLNKLARRAEMVAALNTKQLEIENIIVKVDSLKTQVELLQAAELLRSLL